MAIKSITHNFIIPAHGYVNVTQHLARHMAEKLFADQGTWAIKSSDGFVTPFFSRLEDWFTFHAAWLPRVGALRFYNASRTPLYSCQEHMVSSAATQPAVLPDVPMAPITEFLRIGPRGAMGRDWGYDYGFYTPEIIRNPVRTDPRSRFSSAAGMGGVHTVEWNAAAVIHEGVARTMLWTRAGDRPSWTRNETATKLLRHHFIQGSGLASPEDEADGNVFFPLTETWKPFIDISMTHSQRASEFLKEVGSTFTGWWHATAIKDGWRVFADNVGQLTYAKMKLSI